MNQATSEYRKTVILPPKFEKRQGQGSGFKVQGQGFVLYGIPMFLHMLYTVFYDIPTYMPVIPVISVIPVFPYTLKRGDDDVDDDDDESKSYVRPLLQLETVTGVDCQR